jgi:hypothetical protein
VIQALIRKCPRRMTSHDWHHAATPIQPVAHSIKTRAETAPAPVKRSSGAGGDPCHEDEFGASLLFNHLGMNAVEMSRISRTT